MGWLRDLMRVATPPLRSFDELARRCLIHNSWPAEFRLSGRSLGTLLGKFDREADLEWLTNRPAAQVTLAQVLGTTREALLLALRPEAAAVPGRYFRLDDLPSGRTLDLADEPLFPGLPEEVLAPATWDGLWWQTPSGSGRSLVRAWLRARGLLPEARGRAASAVQRRFVELDADSDATPEAAAGLCVAAPFAPPAGSGFRVVQSRALADTIPELVGWAGDRLPGGGRYQRGELCEWLLRLASSRFRIESAGAVLGLCGLADEFGTDELSRRTPRQLVQWYLRRRAGEALDAEAPATQWVKGSAGDAVVAMLRQLLSESDEPWWRARTASAWSALLPGELRREADLDWLKQSLARVTPAIRPGDVERAARELPPGAYRLLRSLERMGILRRNANDELALRPHWLVELGLGEALAELSRSSPAEWGEALLRPHAAPRVAQALWLRLENGEGSLLEELEELEPERDPALAAASEVAFRVTGLSLLRGSEFSSESLGSLWQTVQELCVVVPGNQPRPRVDFPDGGALLSRSAYQLAAWAIAEQLPGERRDHPLLLTARPHETFDDVLALVEDNPELELGEGVVQLLARLVPSPSGEPQRLAAPAAVLAAIDRGGSSWQLFIAARSTALGRLSFEQLARRKRDRATLLARSAWAAFGQGEPALSGEGLEHDGEFGALLWREAPVSVFASLVERAPQCIPCALLSATQWSAVAAALGKLPASASQQPLWDALPPRELEPLLARGREPGDASSLRGLWRHEPELLARSLEQRFLGGPGSAPVEALLNSAPAARSAEIAQKLAAEATLGSLPSARLHELEQWLHDRVGLRVPGWRTVYDALSRLEQRLSAARR